MGPPRNHLILYQYNDTKTYTLTVRLALRIDTRSPVPPFEQIRAQISLLVASGQARPGTRLPPIRELATRLRVANGTVARAYRELERAEIITARGRAGTFVAANPPIAFAIAERRAQLEEATERFVAEVLRLDVEATEALELVAATLREVQARFESDPALESEPTPGPTRHEINPS